MKKILFLFLLIFIPSVNALTFLDRDTTIEAGSPNINFHGANLHIGINNNSNVLLELPTSLNQTVNLFEVGNDNLDNYYIYTVESYDYLSVTWNTKPLIKSFVGLYNCIPYDTGYCSFELNNLDSKYIQISSNYIGDYVFSSSHAWGEIIFPPMPYTTENTPYTLLFSASGNIKYIDSNINNTNYNLENAFIYINSTLFNYSDSNGNYIINNISNNEYEISISKSGFNTINIETSNNSVNNFTLNYSKPFLTTPYIDGNLIKSNYSHNFLSLNLWENPYFVWGNYDYNGIIKKSVCTYQNNNIFACNLIEGNYKFNMSYSDIYNYNLNTYHPFLTGNRTFYTGDIYIQNDTNLLINPQKLNPDTRENILGENFLNYIFIIFVIIVLIYFSSFNKKNDDYDNR